MTSQIGLIGLAVMGQVLVSFVDCMLLRSAPAQAQELCVIAELCPERR